jgi:hypothetical protein
VLVQEMAGAGVELIIGAQRTEATGAVVMVGFGGVFTEILDDVVFARAPASPQAVLAALARLRTQRLLEGYRGLPKVERAPIASLVSQLSAIMAANPQISEIDLNPVIVTARGPVIVDALIRTGDPP